MQITTKLKMININMKKILGISVVALLMMSSCSTEEKKDYVQIDGQINGEGQSSITLSTNQRTKDIEVNAEGHFNDTIKLADNQGQFFQMQVGNFQTFVYLKNGYDLKVELNESNNDTQLSFTGEGADSNNYLVEKMELNKELLQPDLYYNLDQAAYEAQLAESKQRLTDIIDNAGDIDSALAGQERSLHTRFFDYIGQNYAQEHAMRVKFAPGKPSPQFSNYENYKGGTTSLVDLKGKYVYLDIWATWCGPCKKEIPFLKELEGKYHGKNIEFVSISIDRLNKHEAWKNMVKNEALTGVQLFAGEDQSFMQEYQITGIPRFILVDPQGNIVNANAPRPSSGSVIEGLFTSLGI